MTRFVFLMVFILAALGLSGCCSPVTHFFRCGACIYDNCVVPTAKAPGMQKELTPKDKKPMQTANTSPMTY